MMNKREALKAAWHVTTNDNGRYRDAVHVQLLDTAPYPVEEAMQLQAYLDAKAEEAAGDPDPTTGAPDHCACSHDGRGELVTECQEHQEIREQRDELVSALERACITLRVMLSRLHDPQDDQQRASVARVRYVIEQGETAIAKAKGK